MAQMIHPWTRKRFVDARQSGSLYRHRAKMQLIRWTGWVVGFVIGT